MVRVRVIGEEKMHRPRVYSRHLLEGGVPPPQIYSSPPQSDTKLCALHLFGRDNELQIYHGNFLLTDKKHRKEIIRH